MFRPKHVLKSVTRYVFWVVFMIQGLDGECLLTSLVDADFRDAQLFGCGVQTLNDDVLVCLAGCVLRAGCVLVAGWLALDGDRLGDSHSDILLSTQRV